LLSLSLCSTTLGSIPAWDMFCSLFVIIVATKLF
jgi:hypothetical protein